MQFKHFMRSRCAKFHGFQNKICLVRLLIVWLMRWSTKVTAMFFLPGSTGLMLFSVAYDCGATDLWEPLIYDYRAKGCSQQMSFRCQYARTSRIWFSIEMQINSINRQHLPQPERLLTTTWEALTSSRGRRCLGALCLAGSIWNKCQCNLLSQQTV